MIESVQERQRGAYDFARYYDNLCALQDSCPVPAVKAHLHEGVLDINGDRIRAADWDPILNALSINKNLRFLGVRSYFQLKISENTSERRAAQLKSKIPVIRSKEMTLRLCRAIRDNIVASETLTCIELQGLPLREKDLTFLVKGLAKNKTLKHLSLEYCRIADVGVQIVSQALKQCGNVNTLNLTGCSLSYNGMTAIADLIKHQAMSRHNEAWKESLRYRRPNLDSMSGLRRITLNCNPLIDNEGAASLAEAVKDDMWVKAIDLQQCGIGNSGAKAFLSVLKLNATMTVLDLRQNPLIDRDLLRAVTEQVLVNSDGKESDFRWLRIDDPMASRIADHNHHGGGPTNGFRSPAASERASRGLRCGPVAKRPAFRPSGRVQHSAVPVPPPSQHPQRSRKDREEPESEEARSARGLPWRTAVRASRYKGYPPDHVPGKTHLEEQSVATTNELSSVQTARTEEDVESATSEQTDSVVGPMLREFEESPAPAASLKDLRIQVMHLRRQLNEEMRARRRAEEKMMELMLEKQRMQKDLDRRGLGDVPSVLSNGAGLNEKLLRNIEQSFQQFHAFLDLLRDAGLGRVVTAAGMDQLPRTVPGSANGGLSTAAAPFPIAHRDRRPPSGEDLEVPLDPVEQSYLSAAHARSEADRLYLRLKEATSHNGSDVAHLMPGVAVMSRSGTEPTAPPDLLARRTEEEEVEAEEEEEEENLRKEAEYLPVNGQLPDAEVEASPLEVEEVEDEEEEEVEEEMEEESGVKRSTEVESARADWDLRGEPSPHSPLSFSSPLRPPRRSRSSEEQPISGDYNSDSFEASADDNTAGNKTFPSNDF